MCESETLVKIEEIHGKGRGVVSSRPLRGGEIVLRDSPILIYSAFPNGSKYCDKCFRKLVEEESAAVSCPTCSHHRFCSSNCASSSSQTQTPWLCRALSGLQECSSNVPLERQVVARFLIAAYDLSLISPEKFQLLLSLKGEGRADGDGDGHGDAPYLRSLISSFCPFSFSLELTSSLLAKEKCNSFGLMEPFHFNDNNSGQRSVRAYGIYPNASLFNHDCLPNACRFDYVDSGSPNNTDLIFRMIHDVPQGREICLSYFPVNLNYSTRQNRLLHDFGFICDCDRCKVEATWSDDDTDADAENDAMEEDHDESMGEHEDDDVISDNDKHFPHAYFFLRYMCNRTNCGGTLAPLPPSASNGILLECNVCGDVRTDELGADAD